MTDFPNELNVMTYYMCKQCVTSGSGSGTPCIYVCRHKRTSKSKKEFYENLANLIGFVTGESRYPNRCVRIENKRVAKWELISYQEFIDLHNKERQLANVDENGLTPSDPQTNVVADPIKPSRFSDLDVV